MVLLKKKIKADPVTRALKSGPKIRSGLHRTPTHQVVVGHALLPLGLGVFLPAALVDLPPAQEAGVSRQFLARQGCQGGGRPDDVPQISQAVNMTTKSSHMFVFTFFL